jgi:hypothetical protein
VALSFVDGGAIIKDIVDTGLIDEARRAFGEAYSQYMDDYTTMR